MICPTCRAKLTIDGTTAICNAHACEFEQVDGIWRFLPAERVAHYARFIGDYEHIRAEEGRGSDDSAWYQTLPFHDDPAWRIRAVSYRALLRYLPDRPLKIADMGAGNGWLSNRLSHAGHTVYAVDLLTNSTDGLGAWRHYDAQFALIQAEYDRTPLEDNQCDVVIYNGALHYSEDYNQTLCEGLRLLKPDGQLIVIDTPIYHDGKSGEQMVQEREAQFEQRYGTRSNALDSEQYLTDNRIQQLGQQIGVTWQIVRPFYGLRWHLRPLKARLRGHREPARFHLLIGSRL
jgi:ubiquinone/menaquinone biosynthesis C-methylase UbiE